MQEAFEIISEMRNELSQLNLTSEFDIDIEDYLPSYDEAAQLPVAPVTPAVSTAALATNNIPVTQTGLTQTEQALLSPEEQQIRLRQRGVS
jgi:hypothetical protein